MKVIDMSDFYFQGKGQINNSIKLILCGDKANKNLKD